jgi:hypothetical protein
MAVQARTDNYNFPFVLSGEPKIKDNETLLTDGSRGTTALARFTVMAQIAASRKWVPLTDVAALDGSNTARGILLGDAVTGAALVAGDVTGQAILVGGPCLIDDQQLVLENSLTTNSVCSDDPAGADNGAVNVRRIEDDLARIGIFIKATRDVDVLET